MPPTASASTRSPSEEAPYALSRRNACEICRKRKVRCSGERPSCRTCVRTKGNCVYLSTLTSREYITSLEDKVRRLEAGVGLNEEATTSVDTISALSRTALMPHSYRMTYNPYPSPTAAQREAGNDYEGITMADDGQLVARLPIFGRVVGHIENTGQRNSSSNMVQVKEEMIPPLAIVNELLDHFRAHVSRWYPIYHVPTLVAQFDLVCRDHQPALQKDALIIMLVLALAMTSLTQASPLYPEWKFRSNVYYQYAQELACPPSDNLGYVRLQIALTDLLYVMYNPSAGSIWDMTRSVASLAVDLGLYQDVSPEEQDLRSISPLDVDLRRRAFWIMYSLETAICVVLARPSAIPDAWISVEYPSLFDDSSISHAGIIGADVSPLKMTAYQRFKLRLIQSEIHDHLYSPKSTAPEKAWVDSVLQRLEDWRASLPARIEYHGAELSVTQYHLTLLMLHRPSPGIPSPDKSQTQSALKSAADVIKSQRNMYRTGEMTFNWLTVQQLFAAGISYANCVWQAHRHSWNIGPSHVEALIDIQGWSSVIEAVTALTPGTQGIQPAARAISESIVKLLTESSSANEHSVAVPDSTGHVDVLPSHEQLFDDFGFLENPFMGDDSILGTLWAETFARSSAQPWPL